MRLAFVTVFALFGGLIHNATLDLQVGNASAFYSIQASFTETGSNET